MVQDPVGTAASTNPLLKTLTAAVGAVEGLGDTLNSAEGLTVFAPADPAFAEIPEADLTALLEGAAKDGLKSDLATVLTYHVVEGQLDPASVVGEQTTLQGDTRDRRGRRVRDDRQRRQRAVRQHPHGQRHGLRDRHRPQPGCLSRFPTQATKTRISPWTRFGQVSPGASSDEEAPAAATDASSVLAALLKRAGRGDKDAFAELYDATSARVYGLAVRVVRDPAQAEEVAQESFLEIWRGSARFDPDRGSAIAWMLTIVHRKAVDRVRSAEAASRRDTTYHQPEPDGRARRDRRRRPRLAGGAAGTQRADQPHRGAARGARAGLLRRLHTYRGGQHAGPTDRHRQDPDPGRVDPTS